MNDDHLLMVDLQKCEWKESQTPLSCKKRIMTGLLLLTLVESWASWRFD